MNLIAMDIPDDPSQLAGWLERQLVGLDLTTLVAELAAAHRPTPSRPGALRALLGSRLEQVRSGGLRGLSPADLRHLLRNPSLLLDLQEFVLTEGGPYWTARTQEADLKGLVESGRRRLQDFLTEQAAPEPLAFRPTVRWYRRPWVVGLATAAAVLGLVRVAPQILGLTLPAEVRPDDKNGTQIAQAGWGWNREGALPSDVTAAEYYQKLADSADEWFKKRPEDEAGVARRINEFRQGCTALRFADHKPLSRAQQEDLVQRCNKWARRFDDILVSLETGQTAALKARQQMDEVVEQLTTALRKLA